MPKKNPGGTRRLPPEEPTNGTAPLGKRELIAVARPEAMLRAAPAAMKSAAGMDVKPIEKILTSVLKRHTDRSHTRCPRGCEPGRCVFDHHAF